MNPNPKTVIGYLYIPHYTGMGTYPNVTRMGIYITIVSALNNQSSLTHSGWNNNILKMSDTDDVLLLWNVNIPLLLNSFQSRKNNFT